MSGITDPVPLRIAAVRGQISELGAALRQLRQAGMDDASAQLLLSRKRAELDGLMRRQSGAD
ncbi:MAG: hypothetical protein ABWY82_16535 [Tardiphaga sp.]